MRVLDVVAMLERRSRVAWWQLQGVGGDGCILRVGGFVDVELFFLVVVVVVVVGVKWLIVVMCDVESWCWVSEALTSGTYLLDIGDFLAGKGEHPDWE